MKHSLRMQDGYGRSCFLMSTCMGDPPRWHAERLAN